MPIVQKLYKAYESENTVNIFNSASVGEIRVTIRPPIPEIWPFCSMWPVVVYYSCIALAIIGHAWPPWKGFHSVTRHLDHGPSQATRTLHARTYTPCDFCLHFGRNSARGSGWNQALDAVTHKPSLQATYAWSGTWLTNDCCRHLSSGTFLSAGSSTGFGKCHTFPNGVNTPDVRSIDQSVLLNLSCILLLQLDEENQ
jgi:hypothetical protein